MSDADIICASSINSRQFTVRLRAGSDESKVIYRVVLIHRLRHFPLACYRRYVQFDGLHSIVQGPRLDRAGRQDAGNDPADRVDSGGDEEHNLPRLARALQPHHTCVHKLHGDPVNSVSQSQTRQT